MAWKINYDGVCVVTEGHVTDEDRVNARLISAVPEMLSALKAAQAAYACCDVGDLARAIKSVNAAIKAATGALW
jgi:hypothetical protein